MVKDTNYLHAVGRRKEASVRVRLYKGQGENEVNGKKATSYFSGRVMSAEMERPFRISDTLKKYYFTAKTSGGGKEAQLQALVLGISRALLKVKSVEVRTLLKKAGLITRDQRIRERRKVNTGGKARRMKQSPKR